MGVFDMVALVVVVGCLTGVITEYLKTQRKGGANREDVEDALDRIEDLEERVRVLEKVVTDERYDLSREINKLKDC